ncbi:hypothetical protein UFOVP1382_18 [uncultured Caudovirales phage]|uniref:Uncharacterized protein n=1 Tax=uncultured Caudovirales phage TaxID=2100421 RepID=A0A6J5S3P9_9CAUD|nr:hypothetical protein UFOVP1382_18 [uncultured Caudovirales phage]
MNPLPLDQLRERARTAGSVNVDLADYYALRWHDPEWLGAWSRFESARRSWRKAVLTDGVPFSEIPDMFAPVPANLSKPGHRSAAQEYIDAQAAYFKIRAHFMEAT